MIDLIAPHGSSELKPLLDERAKKSVLSDFSHSLHISSKAFGDLLMMGMGAFTPLEGFMNQGDWDAVCRGMHLSNGVFWPIPITLSCTSAQAEKFVLGEHIALLSPDGVLSAALELSEMYRPDKHFESQCTFGTTDPKHPGVAQLLAEGEVYLAGRVKVFNLGSFAQDFAQVYLTPAQTRSIFKQKGWSSVAAFQTRNPMHRSHEYLTKIALEMCDGVLIHSILGQLKAGDIPAAVRIEAITKLVDQYYPKDSVLQAGYPMDMRYAGPKEALLHAVFRQNFGCRYLIVGRDHAGVGDYYGPFEAQTIFDQIAPNDLHIKPLKIDWTFWCYRCDGMASMRTCPHGKDDRLLLSGTKLRHLLATQEEVPSHFTRPEVLEVLQRYYKSLNS